jgi:hypothetical protein
MSEARQLAWDEWIKELGESHIPDVVTMLDDLSEMDDCIERVIKTDSVTWSPGAYLAFHTVQEIVRNMRKEILAIPMRKE